MSDEQTTYQRLAAPFELSDHARVPKGGMTQTYAPWTKYVERLNDVLGAERWSFRVIREGFTETECWVLGEITATIDGETVTRQQYGCEAITKGQRETPTTDLLKTAASDAVKKAASLLGPGLYLSVKEEREAIEGAMREAVQAEAKRQADARAAKNRPAPPTPLHGTTPQSPPADEYPNLTAQMDAERAAASIATIRCRACGVDVDGDSTVTILKKKDGPRVTVSVADFEPVCRERLGDFHCARCYDQKFWGVA